MKHFEGRTPGTVDPSPFTGARVKPCAGHFREVSPFTIVMTDHVYTATKLCTICRATVSALS